MEWLTDCGDDGMWTETSDEQRLAGSGSPWMAMFGHVVAPGRDGRCVARRGDAPGGDDFTRHASETTNGAAAGGALVLVRRLYGGAQRRQWQGTWAQPPHFIGVGVRLGRGAHAKAEA
jgi:hypothetical protein